ncbi:hypothetical protein INF35_13030 [Subdoligranulum sp. DSM 109015]|uniref:Uncharacterized protein n=1 Tax=Gemmiger gallinarum TaxID=2779354 RepID=A0ABR9R748_9FIRM|nr:hypothetical protein [Gemmiger gallinarum]MBE5038712.1 hypothetical protein [Gemmiger gallinarum]
MENHPGFRPLLIASGAQQAYNIVYACGTVLHPRRTGFRCFYSLIRIFWIARPLSKDGPNFHAGPGGSRRMRKKDFTVRIRVFHVENVENPVETVKNLPDFPERIISTPFCAVKALTNC